MPVEHPVTVWGQDFELVRGEWHVTEDVGNRLTKPDGFWIEISYHSQRDKFFND